MYYIYILLRMEILYLLLVIYITKPHTLVPQFYVSLHGLKRFDINRHDCHSLLMSGIIIIIIFASRCYELAKIINTIIIITINCIDC